MCERSYYVYMMTNSNMNVLYTGVTNDIIRRAYEHRNKLQKGFTKKYNVTRLVYFEMYADVTDAISREKQIKSWSRAKKNNLVKKDNPEWNDLFEQLC